MTTATGIDTREMVVVHTAFRREYREAPAIIASVSPGDRTRAATVGAHVQLMLEMLHHHHTGEDRLLWPKLLDRVPAQLTPVIELMERQHEGVDAELQRATALLARWREGAAPDDRDQLAGCLEGLTALLVEHLAAEEEQILPLAAQCLTVQEWDELGEAGMAGIPKKQLPAVFGMIMKDGEPDVIRSILAHAPLPVRLLLPRVAPGIHRRYARRLTGA
jgi:hemerythrin HHE cation binding domain-containing protein